MVCAYATLVEAPTTEKQRFVEVISYFDANAKGIRMHYDDAVFVSMSVANFDEKKLVHNGISISILFYDTFYKMSFPRELL